ncbi:MAG: Ig domain-containing protein [Sphingomonas sp.]
MQVVDSSGGGGPYSATRDYSGTIRPVAIRVLLPDSFAPRVGVPFSVTATAEGGTAPYIFDLGGSTLPAGLTLSPGGVISGTPTAVTVPSKSVTIRATDSSPAPGPYSGSQQTVFDVGPAIGIKGPGTFGVFRGVPLTVSYTADGGQAPYSFSATDLPDGFTMSTDGILSGSPPASGPISPRSASPTAWGTRLRSVRSSWSIPSRPRSRFPCS